LLKISNITERTRQAKAKATKVKEHATEHVKKVVNPKKYESRFMDWPTETLKELLVYHGIEGEADCLTCCTCT